MAHPKAAKHARLGDLARCDLTDAYEGSIALKNGSVSLSIDIDDEEDLVSMLDGAAKTVDQALAMIDMASAYAATKLTDVHNEGWTNGKPEITETEFTERIKLESVEVDSGGSIVLHFNDGDLFWGHSIRVEGFSDEGFSDAYFEG